MWPRLLHGQTLFTNLEILPALMLDRGPEPGTPEYETWMEANPNGAHPLPVKTVPAHHSPVRLAAAGDVAEIFGDPADGDGKHFIIGHTREQGHPVCIDLEKFVQRSSGVFRRHRHGQIFPHPAAAGRIDPVQQVLTAGVRYAQRIRL